MMPSLPTPAAARYSAAGEPSPPAPPVPRRLQQLLSARTNLGQQQMAAAGIFAGAGGVVSRRSGRTQMQHVSIAQRKAKIRHFDRMTNTRMCAPMRRVRRSSGITPRMARSVSFNIRRRYAGGGVAPPVWERSGLGIHVDVISRCHCGDATR
jgi:hypothetical protein